MSLSDANEALQRATRKGNWIYWRGDGAWLANSRGSVLIGGLSEGLDSLMARMPECEGKLDFITGVR